MAQFTRLDDEDIRHLAEAFALGSVRQWKSIAAGTINSNYKIETDAGSYFLRVNEGKERAEVALEADILQHLATRGIPTPEPVESKEGERFVGYRGKPVSVFEWRAGGHVNAQSIEVEHCASAGRALAALHLAGLDFSSESLGAGRYSYERVKSRLRTIDAGEDPELSTALQRLAAEVAWLDSKKECRAGVPRGLIHADLFPDNVLMEGTQIVALLDFEQACSASLVYDLAVTANAWCFARDFVPERLAALVSGYQEHRCLDSRERAAFWPELRAAALRFTVTRITDVYLPARKSGATQGGKDYRRFLMRLECWAQSGAEDILGLADLAQEPSGT